MQQKIIILDFGSQTTQLIARRLRELDTFCEILPYNKFPQDDKEVIGVILAGSPTACTIPKLSRSISHSSWDAFRCSASAMVHSSFPTTTAEM